VSALNAAILLDAWERGLPQGLPERALTLLSAWSAAPAESWQGKSIGERDASLLRLREEVFGPWIEATASCPGCGATLQLAFDVGALRATAPAELPLRLVIDGYEVVYRLPTSLDLVEAVHAGQTDGRHALLSRCLASVRLDGAPMGELEMPASVVDAVVEGMRRADPQADVRVAVQCLECAHSASIGFDILSFLWTEIEDWARRVVLEVHALASAYGWGESEILAMSARRRRLYAQVVGG